MRALVEAFESAPTALLLVDADDVVCDANGAFLDHAGRAGDDVVGRALADLGAPLVGLREAAAEARRTGRLSSQDGIGTALPFGDGRVLLTVGPGTVTRTAAKISRPQAEEVLASISDAFFALDREWRFSYVNAQAEPLLERRPEELLGLNVWEAFPEAVGSPFYQAYHRAVETGRPEHFDAFYAPLDRHFAVRAFPFATGLSVYFADVTDLKRAEAALRESKARLALALEAGGVGAWEWDVATDALVYDSRAAAMWDVGPAELPTASAFIARIHADDQPAVEEALALALAPTESDFYESEFRYIRPDGSVRWLVGRGAVVRADDGTAVGLYGLNLDVTERREQEEALRRINNEMERFAYTVSHDLKSPLVTVTGFLGILKAHLAAGRTDEAAGAADRIADAARRLSGRIDGLLRLSRAGLAAAEPVEVDLERVVSRVAGNLSARAERAGGSIRVGTRLGRVLADPERVAEATENLLANAITYALAEGASHVTVRSEATADGALRLVVEDDGPGVPEADRERIFGLFQRVHRDTRGSGVGLALVARTMETLGGTAHVEPARADGDRPGARFVLSFPPAAVVALPGLSSAETPLSRTAEP